MKKSVIAEVKQIIKKQNLNCSVKEFKDNVDWPDISYSLVLSEAFIREFKKNVDWYYISDSQVLSEAFIREFKDDVRWNSISSHQVLSESFIREFKDEVEWDDISLYQVLSENFIREFKDYVYWDYISCYRHLSESFIREFKNDVDWNDISHSQVLSEDFIKEFMNEIDIKLYHSVHKEKSLKQKTKEIKEYAKTHNLKFDGKYLYAFRNHDEWGHGAFNKTITYQKGKYYKDWHCDMRKNIENSFGLGIWPKGNTPVKVKVSDWGVCANRDDGKARVCGFEVI